MSKPPEWIDDIDNEDLETTEKSKIPEDQKTKELAELADEYEGFEFDIAELEKHLATLKERFLRLKRETIPDRMQELGVKKFVLTDGAELSYKPLHSGRVLKEEEAYAWLEAHGFADCVKDELNVVTSRLDSAVIDELKEFLSKFSHVDFKEKVSIHHMTLGSIIKDLNSEGKALPSDLFNVYIGNVATLKKGKSDGI